MVHNKLSMPNMLSYSASNLKITSLKFEGNSSKLLSSALKFNFNLVRVRVSAPTSVTPSGTNVLQTEQCD